MKHPINDAESMYWKIAKLNAYLDDTQKDDNDTQNLINTLPADIFNEIIAEFGIDPILLTRASAVCHQWHIFVHEFCKKRIEYHFPYLLPALPKASVRNWIRILVEECEYYGETCPNIPLSRIFAALRGVTKGIAECESDEEKITLYAIAFASGANLPQNIGKRLLTAVHEKAFLMMAANGRWDLLVKSYEPKEEGDHFRNISQELRYNAWVLASARNYPDTARNLTHVWVNIYVDKAVLKAAGWGNLTALKRLMSHPHLKKETLGIALIQAAAKGKTEVAGYLANLPRIPLESKKGALCAAQQGGHLPAFREIEKACNLHEKSSADNIRWGEIGNLCFAFPQTQNVSTTESVMDWIASRESSRLTP